MIKANMVKMSKAFDGYIKPYKKEIDIINSMLESGFYIGNNRKILLNRKHKLLNRCYVKRFIELNKSDKLFN